MKTENYSAICYISKNQRGLEEIALERKATMWDKIKSIFFEDTNFITHDTCSESWVRYGDAWINDHNGTWASKSKVRDLKFFRNQLRCNKAWHDLENVASKQSNSSL